MGPRTLGHWGMRMHKQGHGREARRARQGHGHGRAKEAWGMTWGAWLMAQGHQGSRGTGAKDTGALGHLGMLRTAGNRDLGTGARALRMQGMVEAVHGMHARAWP